MRSELREARNANRRSHSGLLKSEKAAGALASDPRRWRSVFDGLAPRYTCLNKL